MIFCLEEQGNVQSHATAWGDARKLEVIF